MGKKRQTNGSSFYVGAEWTAGLALGFVHFLFVQYIYRRVPDPYMDEEFHVDQARRYCAGDFHSWNDKITTPPALYLLTVPFFCGNERFVNSFLLPICFAGLCSFRRSWMADTPSKDIFLMALVTISLPVLLDTSILYYTDLLSLTAILWAFRFQSSPNRAALCFAVAVLTRQTNIIWAGAYCLLAWWPSMSTNNRSRWLKDTVRLALRHWAFAGLGVIFLAFVYINKGIVLGDRTSHVPVAHLVQPLYFLAFTTFSSFPLFVSYFLKKKYQPVIRRPMLSLFLLIMFIVLIRFFTYSHPFLLADNRHFPFYLWRKFFARHWLCKYSLSPVYLLSLFYVYRKLSQTGIPGFSLVFLLSTCACICPAHLIEFRYFIIPYVLWRMTLSGVPRKWILLELLWSICINGMALYLFLERPFTWSHDPTRAVQRFMW